LQRHASAGCARDKPLLFVDNVALDQADNLASPNHPGLGAELCFPHGPQEIDLQFKGREAVVLGERRAICDAHCGVGKIAENSAVERSHWVRMAVIRIELHNRVSFLCLNQFETEELSNRRRERPLPDWWEVTADVGTGLAHICSVEHDLPSNLPARDFS